MKVWQFKAIVWSITWGLIIGLCVLVNTCSHPPEQTVETYLNALYSGDAATAWNCLSDQAQYQITQFYRDAMAMDQPEIQEEMRLRLRAVNNLQFIVCLGLPSSGVKIFWARLVREGKEHNWLPLRSAGLETIHEHGQWKVSELPKFPVKVGTMWLMNLKVAQSKAANGLPW